MTAGQIPLWVEVVTAFFTLLSAFIALLAASGILRLNSFFERVHSPALVNTVGIWCLMLAAIFFFTALQGSLPLDMLLIGLFISVTTPVTTIFLMRAALFRARQRGENVPSSVNALRLAAPQHEPADHHKEPTDNLAPENNTELTADISPNAESATFSGERALAQPQKDW